MEENIDNFIDDTSGGHGLYKNCQHNPGSCKCCTDVFNISAVTDKITLDEMLVHLFTSGHLW